MNTLAISLAPAPPSFGSEALLLSAAPRLGRYSSEMLSPVLTVNGVPLFSAYARVNTVELLAHSTVEGEVALLVCPCGSPACAKHEEPVVVQLGFDGEPLLVWSIPREGYELYVRPEHGPGPWRFVFSLNAVLQQLEQVEAQLQSAVRERGTASLPPCLHHHHHHGKVHTAADLAHVLHAFRHRRVG